ncbi:MAG TPA: TetR/AcrR family transcriptional regulator [bacterium]|jgi:AcrR family transcriptional regulator|nr:TetR/AcrR family transcriptional regulator [bacterium]
MSRPIAKRQNVMDAALKLFVEKGIEGTTTREIAELAHAGEGTMFRHFESKEELAWHLFNENLSAFVKHLEEAIAGQSTAKGKIRSMVEAGFTLYETDPILCTFLLLTEHSAARRMPPGYKTPINLILEVLEAGQKTGEVKPMNSHLAAALVFGAISRVPFFKRSGLVTRDLRELVDEVNETVWKMIQV